MKMKGGVYLEKKFTLVQSNTIKLYGRGVSLTTTKTRRYHYYDGGFVGLLANFTNEISIESRPYKHKNLKSNNRVLNLVTKNA